MAHIKQKEIRPLTCKKQANKKQAYQMEDDLKVAQKNRLWSVVDSALALTLENRWPSSK